MSDLVPYPRPAVCARWCRYHHPDKPEEVGCGPLAWLAAQPGAPAALEGLEPDPERPLAGLDRDDPRLTALCAACAYRVDGCDFRDPAVDRADCAPCGGLRAAAALWTQGGAWSPLPHPDSHVRLADHVLPRHYATPALYDRRHDELYELNREGYQALLACRGDLTLAQAGLAPEFRDFCLAEGLLDLSERPRPRPLVTGPSPRPSLRYLELQVTWRCDLACRHCYLGQARAVDLPVPTIAAALREFAEMGGLRVLISGGEPLMHPRWPEINALLAAYPLRRVLLSNGRGLLRPQVLAELNVDEVQLSLDGLENGHQMLRGPGSFAPVLEAARAVVRRELALSVATQAHPGNLDELDGLGELVQELGAREWSIDAPCLSGRLADHPELCLTPALAATALEHGFGGSYHGGGQGVACGLHLCTVAADGRVAQCGFYLDEPLGRIDEGLWTCWARRVPLALARIPACADCPAAEDCGGGCRFRAGGRLEPDPVMCALAGRDLGR